MPVLPQHTIQLLHPPPAQPSRVWVSHNSGQTMRRPWCLSCRALARTTKKGTPTMSDRRAATAVGDAERREVASAVARQAPLRRADLIVLTRRPALAVSGLVMAAHPTRSCSRRTSRCSPFIRGGMTAAAARASCRSSSPPARAGLILGRRYLLHPNFQYVDQRHPPPIAGATWRHEMRTCPASVTAEFNRRNIANPRRSRSCAGLR
jgi:hypothetical protein